jgi:hypothetical protein
MQKTKTRLIAFIKSVIGMRDNISLLTLFPLANDMPKSNANIALSHDIYCTKSGLSKPYTAFNRSISLGVILGFSSPLAKKEFGARCIAPKEIMLIKNSINAI